MNFGIYIFINSFAVYYLFIKFIKQNLLWEFRLFNYYMCKYDIIRQNHAQNDPN